MIKEKAEKKYCPECKSEFICEHSASCWCSVIEISAKVSAYLNEKYSDCLCKKCLEKAVIQNNKTNHFKL